MDGADDNSFEDRISIGFAGEGQRGQAEEWWKFTGGCRVKNGKVRKPKSDTAI
jgi:hypothetical protein